MKFEVGDRVHMYNWQTARGIMRALGKTDKTNKDFVYGISKGSWNRWRNADDLTVVEPRWHGSFETYRIRSASLDGKNGILWIVPAVCMYKK